MNTWLAARLARQLMDEHGLHDWGFRFNRRKNDMGCCHYHHQRIELSQHFVGANEQAIVRDTILHEIAHALAGHRAGHGPKWKRICRRIGATPQRCGHATMPEGQWQAVCGGCGWRYSRHRRPARGATYYCSSCGPESGALHFQRRQPLSQPSKPDADAATTHHPSPTRGEAQIPLFTARQRRR